MNLKRKKLIGIAIGLTWFLIVVTTGWRLFEHLAESYGDIFGALSLLYLLGCVLVLFIGRALLERLLVTALRLDVDAKQTWTSATVSPVQKPTGFAIPFGAAAVLTMSGVSGTHAMMDHTKYIDSQIPTFTSST